MERMVKVFRTLLIICLIIGIGFWLSGYFFQTRVAESASTDNVSGYAGSENIGWISFNCTNTNCSSSNYGVNVDPITNNFSGYAWSENIGWINFAPSGPYPAEPNYSAKYNFSNEKVTGWARTLAYSDGWDGWILLGKESGGWANQVTIDLDTGVFHGWAWGSDLIGWISFNCADRGVCGTSSYAVIIGPGGLNRPPFATNLNLTNPDWCAEPPSYFFSWTYSDPDADPESRFDFQVDNNSNFGSPEIDRTYTNLSNPSPSQNNQSVVVAIRELAGYLIYNQTYYWRVRVWDSRGADSGWVSGSLFTTQPHHYPSSDFTWKPQNPSPEEKVKFTDETVFYSSTGIAWSWTFQDGDPASSIEQNPDIVFQSQGSKQVALTATDSHGYSCSIIKSVQVSLPLPKWQEIKPW